MEVLKMQLEVEKRGQQQRPLEPPTPGAPGPFGLRPIRHGPHRFYHQRGGSTPRDGPGPVAGQTSVAKRSE